MKTHKRIEEIEVLRGIAVLAVFVYHGAALLYSPGVLAATIRSLHLELGVDLFFVISGFVISRELIGSIEAARAQGTMRSVVYAFWTRRAFRLLPSAWLSLAVLILIAFFYNSSGAAGSKWGNVWDALYAAVHLANFHWYQCMWASAQCGVNPVYWSLSLEEQFYLLLPLVLVALGPRSIYFFVIACVVQIFTVRNGWSATWIIRTDGLLMGVLLGYFSKTRAYEHVLMEAFKVRPLMWIASLAILVLVPWNPTAHPLWIGITAIFAGVLVLLASADKGLLMPAGVLRTALTWVGSRSYAIYLFHVPVNLFVLESANRFLDTPSLAAGKYNALLVASSFLLTMGLSNLNFRFVETPFRKVGSTLSKRILASAGSNSRRSGSLTVREQPAKR